MEACGGGRLGGPFDALGVVVRRSGAKRGTQKRVRIRSAQRVQCTLPCSPAVKVTVQSVLGQSGARAMACRAVGRQKVRARGWARGMSRRINTTKGDGAAKGGRRYGQKRRMKLSGLHRSAITSIGRRRLSCLIPLRVSTRDTPVQSDDAHTRCHAQHGAARIPTHGQERPAVIITHANELH